MKLLHIIATPREQESRTMRVTNFFLKCMQEKYDDLNIEVIDLFNFNLPAIAGENIEAKYTLIMGQPIDKQHKESWNQIERLIQHFLSADMYLISTPMWNFSIPYALKYYIDCIIQPGYLYKYNEIGQPVPLVNGKRMVCITSRGGDYSPNSLFRPYDFQEPYLRTIFGFVGITEMYFVNAQPMDITPELREQAIATSIMEANNLVANTDWSTPIIDQPIVNPPELKPRPK